MLLWVRAIRVPLSHLSLICCISLRLNTTLVRLNAHKCFEQGAGQLGLYKIMLMLVSRFMVKRPLSVISDQ